MIKTKHGTCTIYIYGSLCISFNVFCTVWVPARANVSQHHNGWQSVCLLVFVYWIVETVSAGFYSLSVESRMHLKCCICFTESEKKNPFSSSIVFAQSLTCVFFSLSGKSQDSPNTAQGADRKVLFGGENKVFWCWFLSPQRTLRKERRGETKKKVFLCLSRSRLSLGREWSPCLITGWG